MPFKILVIDDKIHDKTETISSLPALLQSVGYEVATTADGVAAYDLVFEYLPDLIVLDIQFERQGINGIEICRSIREAEYRAPIILVTAIFKETDDVLAGFEAGADDYVIRPRDNREILARIRANLPPEIVEMDDRIRIDFNGRRVWVKARRGMAGCLLAANAVQTAAGAGGQRGADHAFHPVEGSGLGEGDQRRRPGGVHPAAAREVGA